MFISSEKKFRSKITITAILIYNNFLESLIFVIIKSTPAKNQSFIKIHAREHSTAIFGLTISQSGTVEHVRIWWVVEMGSHFKSGSGTLPSVDGAGES